MEVNVWRAVSADPYETQLVALKLFALTLTLGLLLQYTSSPRRFRLLVHVVLGVAVASALFGVVRQATQRDAYFLMQYLTPSSGYAQFINRNHFAFLMEMALGLVLGLAVAGSMRRHRLLIYLVGAVCVWLALVLTNSRGGIFSMLSQVLFLTLLWSTTRDVRKSQEQPRGVFGWISRTTNTLMHMTLIICLVAAMFVGVLWVGGDPLVSQMDSIPKDFTAEGTNQRSNTNRTHIWKATWQLIKANPLAGVGFGGYWIAIPQYHNASGEFSPQEAHNDYLELLASGGLIGAALALWFFAAVIKLSLGHLRAGDSFRRAACLGALAGLFGAGVHSLVDFGLHVTVNAVVFIVLVVIATADDRVNEKARLGNAIRQRRLRLVSLSKP
jgi:O-antigen ligase